MNAQALLDRAARCEAAEGADRTLDELIALAVSPDRGPPGFWLSFESGEMEPREFTRSIDAAMSLVDWADLKERQYRFGLEQDDFSDAWIARVDQLCDAGDTILAKATTKELAVTALALKARAASVDTHPKGGNSPKSEVPFMSGAVPPEEAGDAQPTPIEHSGNTGEGK